MRPSSAERVPGMPAHLKGGDIDPPTKPRRQRVVLGGGAQGPIAPSLRARVELAEQTSWGEMLIRDLISALLRWGLVLAVAAVLVLGLLPLVFWLVPGFASFTVAGVPIAWLILGLAPFPLLFGIGVAYDRLAERHERDFVDMIEN